MTAEEERIQRRHKERVQHEHREAQQEHITALVQHVSVLKEHVKTVQARVVNESQKSSLPPSSDRLTRHKKARRDAHAERDAQRRHRVAARHAMLARSGRCASGDSHRERTTARVLMTEDQEAWTHGMRCQRSTRTPFPAEAKAAVQDGPVLEPEPWTR